MKRYFIENVRCDITDGGMACGPVGGSVVVTAKIKDDGEPKWFSIVEAMGFPNAYVTEKDIFEDLVEEDFDNKEFTAYCQEHFVDDFNGIKVGSDYSDIFGSIAENSENPAVPLIRYMIAVLRCPMEEVDDLIKMAEGKYADELENLPTSDVEEDYQFELEYEPDDDEEE